jgi:CDP-diacylglycerol pyrophosphatase
VTVPIALRRARRAFLPAAAAVLALVASARAGDPDALWKIVHDRCVPDQTAHGDPAPCAHVSVDGGFVVLKDRAGVAQYLVIPTAKVTGIEDAAILAPDAPNYWQAAWAARTDMLARLGHDLPRDAISLAINSPTGRSQNQLHIHIDCVRQDVRVALDAHEGALTTEWAPFPGGLLGHPYVARRLDGADLDPANPFRLLAAAPGVGPQALGKRTLVVVGATFPGDVPGFVLLADTSDLASGDRANGEELQDHDCAVASAP